MPVKLKYGVGNSNKLLHINEVERGIACNCSCPECGDSLIARKGEKNQYHFAHSSGIECKSAPETAIHKLAKEIILENEEICLNEKSIYQYDSCELEKSYELKIIDAIVTKGQETLFVEIVVTNNISKEKEEILLNSGYSTLVIDLQSIDREIERDQLEKEVLANCNNRRIISKEDINEEVNDANSRFKGFEWLLLIGFVVILYLLFGRKSESKYLTKKRYSKLKRRKKYGT